MKDLERTAARSGEIDPHNIIATMGLIKAAFLFGRAEMDKGINDDVAFKLLVGEVGELSRAMSHEDGDQLKDDVDEKSPGEAFDVAFSALAMFCRRGGTPEEITRLLIQKSEAWAKNLLPSAREPLHTILNRPS